MNRRTFGWVVAALLIACLAVGPGLARQATPPVAARIETTLATGGDQIRQFAFDGDPNTCFASAGAVMDGDHFTLVFDRPVAVRSVAVVTGRADGSDPLDAGVLELSPDGKTFHEGAKFKDGTARARMGSNPVQAIRIRPAAQTHPLAICEITVEAEPEVALFKYPVEVVVDVADAPEMKEWAEKVARECERVYPMLNEELKSDGYKPRHQITLSLKSSYNGVAATGGGHITGSVRYFKAHPDDVGALIHETCHVVQGYRGRNNPGWLVEGVADYVRFFKYEPGKLGRINPERAHYNGSYRVTAAFLNSLCEKYDRTIVRRLNQAMREGRYTDDLFRQLTGKTLPELDDEWRATLGK
jgi:hypothetical protein